MKEPKFILSKEVVLEKYKECQEISDLVSYSSKTNPLVSSILEEKTESYFSVHSLNELKNIKDKSRIIFLAQGWNSEEFDFLISEGIRYFVVDNEFDLDVLKKEIENKDIEVNVFLRLKLKENTLKTEKYFVFGFGSDFISKEILNLKENPKIKSVGIHFHRKTQNIAEWGIKREIENVFDESVLKKMNYIIIGGGLPSVYANTNVKIFDGIKDRILEFKNWINEFDCKMIIEPGRFIAAPSVKLVSNIRAIYENNIILDVSVYNSDLDALIVPVKLLVEGESEKGTPYVIKGITPCSMDLFRYKVYLDNPKVGDEIVFLNAGAYNFSTDFCDLEKIKTEIVEKF